MDYFYLSNGKKVLVDAEDYEKVIAIDWKYQLHKGKEYVRVQRWVEGKNVTTYLHSFLMNGRMVDHINGNGLDCRKQNMRVCSKKQNNMNRSKAKNNTSGYKGAYWRKDRSTWQSRISVEGKNVHLGYFPNSEDAARAYDKAARSYYGEFGKLNFL